jgi:hypothetical protein
MQHRGHPYATRELADKRAEQRRVLRPVPGWIFTRIKLSSAPAVQRGDEALIESQLRDAAHGDITGPLAPLLESFRLHLEVEPITDFLRAAIDAGPESFEASDRFASITNPLAEAERSRRIGSMSDPSLTPILHRLIAMLAWADELADDDYTDPRLLN